MHRLLLHLLHLDVLLVFHLHLLLFILHLHLLPSHSLSAFATSVPNHLHLLLLSLLTVNSSNKIITTKHFCSSCHNTLTGFHTLRKRTVWQFQFSLLVNDTYSRISQSSVQYSQLSFPLYSQHFSSYLCSAKSTVMGWVEVVGRTKGVDAGR